KERAALVEDFRLSFNIRQRLVDALSFGERGIGCGHILLPSVEHAESEICCGGLLIQLRSLHVSFNCFSRVAVLPISSAHINKGVRFLRVGRTLGYRAIAFNRAREIARDRLSYRLKVEGVERREH